jgi:hypothetical protein
VRHAREEDCTLRHAIGSASTFIGAWTPRSLGRARPGGAAAGVMAVKAMASSLARWTSREPVAGPFGDGSERVGTTG